MSLPEAEPLFDLDAFLDAAHAQLEPILGEDHARETMRRARGLLERGVHPDGIKATIFQIIRNRDPEMKVNHVTELNLADAFSKVPGRLIEVERQASGRNERRVDFGLDDPDHTFLVEVKNLNAPLIKRADDPLTERLCGAVKGMRMDSDVHLTYLFFRRPREHDIPMLERQLRRAWETYGGWSRAELADLERDEVVDAPLPRDAQPLTQVFEFLPHENPRIAALFVPARKDTGGRVIVYDHGDHLHAHPGARVRAGNRSARGGPSPRERVEELFIKDNIARRLQDAEGKFPLERDLAVTRVVAFYLGDWAPYSRLERYLRQVCHWYVHGAPTPEDFWGAYYPHWARRWRFDAHGNIDAVIALRGVGYDRPYQAVSLFSREDGLLERLFGV